MKFLCENIAFVLNNNYKYHNYAQHLKGHKYTHLKSGAFSLEMSICKPLVVYRVQYMSLYRSQTRRHMINIFNPRKQGYFKVRKRTKIRNRCNQSPHLTQVTNGKVTTSQLDITNVGQEVSPFPTGDHKAPINRRARKHNNNKTEIT